MPDLPTGTVTFLFTDIEGSTRMLQELGERYAAVRDEHAAIIRRAVAERRRRRGQHGRGFLLPGLPQSGRGRRGRGGRPARPGRPRLVLRAHRCGCGWVSIRGRGSPGRGRLRRHRREPGGPDLRRGPRRPGHRLRTPRDRWSSAHLPEGSRSGTSGEHRLKDIVHPEHLHDLVIEGLPSDFPPPRTLDARPNNLPLQLTSFVGREERDRRGPGAARPGPAADPDRRGRDGEDAAGAPGARQSPHRVPGRRLLRRISPR